MASLPQLAYWDLVAIASILPLPLYPLLNRKANDVQPDLGLQGFIEDNSVVSYEDDHFNRKAAASEIARLIQSTNNQKSFAIGILGEYGSGKTSFLKLIDLGLDHKQILRINFDPWSAGNPEMIRREFFDLLASDIASMDSKISSLIYSYGRKLASFDTRSLSFMNWFGFLHNPHSTQNSGEYQQINKMLRATGRKIVITIDDLDRLYPDEIMEVLKLIRNTADFSNVFYLVGYDKMYVQNAIQTLSDAARQDYLDKIFQLEIPLPKREGGDLINALQEHLKTTISTAHYEVFQNTLIPTGFHNKYQKAYSRVLRQGRDVIRFINGFKIIYRLIGEEVDFESLLVLELIKFRFPTIYELIYSHSDHFLYENPIRSTHEQYFLPYMEKSEGFNNDISVFKTYIEKLEWLKPEDVGLLNNLFLTLFKGSLHNSPKPKNSISYPLYFDIYFRYRLSQTDISDKDFKAALASDNMYEYMVYCASNNLHKELLVRLMQEDISKDQYHFEKIVTCIFTFGRTFIEKEGFMRFDYDALINKIYNYDNAITNKLYKKDISSYTRFIKRIFDTASPPYLLENELIYHLKKKGEGFVLTIPEMVTYQLSFFTRYAESGHGLDKDALWIFWGARESYREPAIESDGYYEQWRFEPLLVPKMKAYLNSKDPKEFLKFSIQHDRWTRPGAFIHKQVLEIFDTPSEYRKLVSENPALNADIKREYLELFDKCLAKDFKGYVEMEFKTELKKLE
ncbi:KAP family P-loop NTPase fold protein [Chitinophaga ginsengisegetis]|nr:P-loop NTPase fold protein [Chitinophaga ginsengisegetis]